MLGKRREWPFSNRPTVDSLTPSLTASLGQNRHAVGVSSGRSFTCALLDNGSIACWGLGSSGQAWQ